MKALLLNNLLNLSAKSKILFILVSLIMTLFPFPYLLFSFMHLIILCTCSSITVDETYSFILTTPIKYKDFVNSKYIFSYLLTTILLSASSLLKYLYLIIFQTDNLNESILIFNLFTGIFTIYLVNLVLPLAYRFRANDVYSYIVLILSTLFVGRFIFNLEIIPINPVSLNILIKYSILSSPIFLFSSSIISQKISLLIFENKILK